MMMACVLFDDIARTPVRRSPLTAFDEGEIIVNCLDLTRPKDPVRMEKFLADLNQLLDRLGLNDLPKETAQATTE